MGEEQTKLIVVEDACNETMIALSAISKDKDKDGAGASSKKKERRKERRATSQIITPATLTAAGRGEGGGYFDRFMMDFYPSLPPPDHRLSTAYHAPVCIFLSHFSLSPYFFFFLISIVLLFHYFSLFSHLFIVL